jgi:cyclohexyl-isocyanide hydratase
MNQIRGSKQLQIGALIFPGVDQIDFTGPFEVFSRIPGATCHVIAKDRKPIRDARGLILTPEKTYSEISQLDLLHVPGGPGQEALMDDEETLSFIREQGASTNYIFSACTRSGWFAGGEKSDNPLGRYSFTKLLRRHSDQRASGY